MKFFACASVVLCLTGCRSEEERARERANDAALACGETTRASRLPIIDGPLDTMDDEAPVLRIRSNGLEFDARAAFASRPNVVAYFGKGNPAIEPLRLDELKPFGTEDWYLLPKLQKALSDYSESQRELKYYKQTLVLDVAPDASVAHVAAVVGTIKFDIALAARGRDGVPGMLWLVGYHQADWSNERCTYALQQNPRTCIAPAVNLRKSGAQLYAWNGLANEPCVEDPQSRRDDDVRGPFAAGEGCEFPVTSTEELNALGKAVREVAAIEPGCENVVLTVEPTMRWSEVSPVISALMKQGAPRRVALLGAANDLARCSAQPIRPATWKPPK